MTPLHDTSMMEVLLEIKGDIGEIKATMTGLVKDVGDIDDRLDPLEAAHNRSKGVLAAVGTAWAVIVLGVEYLIRKSH